MPEWFYPALFSAVLGYWSTRLQERTATAERRLNEAHDRVIRLEESLRAVDGRVGRAESAVEGIREDVADIREHMARREDLAALTEFLKGIVK